MLTKKSTKGNMLSKKRRLGYIKGLNLLAEGFPNRPDLPTCGQHRKQFWPPGVCARLYILLCLPCQYIALQSIVLTLYYILLCLFSYNPLACIFNTLFATVQDKQHRSLQVVSYLLILTLASALHHCQNSISTL